MIDDARLQWRRTPVQLVYSRNMGYNLLVAGYRTLGDVLASTDDDLAGRVANVGLKRAAQIRSKALAAARAADEEASLYVMASPGQPPRIVVAARPAPEQDAEPEHAPPGVTGPLLALAAVGCFGTLLFLSIS